MLAITWRAVLGWAVVIGLRPVAQAQTSPPPVLTVVKAEPAPEWSAKFTGKKGWIGGDGAYTVVLKDQRVLWLFGDTLLGSVKDGGRPGAVMVNNTLGVQRGEGKDAAIRFIAGKAKDGKPTAIFVPQDGKGWFWQQAAVRVGDRLFIFLTQIDKGKDPGVLGFRHVGQWLAVIENPDAEPSRWRTKQLPVPFARFVRSQVQSWGSAVLVEGDMLYIYGYQEKSKAIGTRKLLVARVPARKLADFTAWRIHTADGWSAKAEAATPLASELATEFSVTRSPSGKGYLLVYTENGLGDRIVCRCSLAPAGPWSAPVLLYHCPEMVRDRGLFCYGAKAHSWAVKDKQVLISYCVNTWEFARLFRDEKLYRPRFLRVQFERVK
ncbi:MAG TPA: DUF4185 domain-containing protein [Gemmataceae bacterium]|nr:DUF4185 domain-containing protein [Gemmataceae bacterium]